MSRTTCAILGISLAWAAIASAVGVPRLIGTGCTSRPLGLTVALAREESDMPRCERIERLADIFARPLRR